MVVTERFGVAWLHGQVGQINFAIEGLMRVGMTDDEVFEWIMSRQADFRHEDEVGYLALRGLVRVRIQSGSWARTGVI